MSVPKNERKYKGQRDNLELIRRRVDEIKRNLVASSGGSGNATEAQQINQIAQVANLLLDLDKKPCRYIDTTVNPTVGGGGALTFPYDLVGFSWGPTGRAFAATTVNNTTELSTLWNTHMPELRMTARDADTVWVESAGQYTPHGIPGTSGIQFVSLGNSPLWVFSSYPGVLAGSDDVLLDCSQLDSNLDFIQKDIEAMSGFLSQVSYNLGNVSATEAKQDDIIAAIGSASSTDYEVLETYGRDSIFFVNYFIESGSETAVDPSVSGNPAPTITVGGDLDSIQIDQANNNYYVQFDIDKDYSSTDDVEINLNFEVLSTGTGGAITDITIELIDTSGATILDSVVEASGFFPTQSGTTTLSYDNSVTNFAELSIRITPVAPNPFGNPSSYFFDGFEERGSGLLPLPEESIIKKLDKYEGNVLISTDYLTKDDVPYSLLGDFIPDNNVVTTELIKENLSESKSINLEIAKLTSANTFTEEFLSQAALSDLYINFKELTFTVTSGTVDVTLDSGTPVTYPVGPVTGNTYTADTISATSISIDRTNGDYLVTVKS